MKFVSFDLETTGFDEKEGKIVEFGYSVWDHNEEEIHSGSIIINPNMKMRDEVIAVHGITNEMAAKGIQWDYFWNKKGKKILEYADVYIGQNLDFDLRWLKYHTEDMPERPIVDTLAFSRRYFSGLKNNKLGTLAEHFGVSLENAHRAGDDAKATVKLFFKMCDNIGIAPIDILDKYAIGPNFIGKDPFEIFALGQR